MITVLLAAALVVWVVAPLPLAVAVGRAFAAGGASPERPAVRSAAAGPVDA